MKSVWSSWLFLYLLLSPLIEIAQADFVPNDLRIMADKFIESQVGKDYFSRNYTYDEGETKRRSNSSTRDYFVHYQYKPLTTLGVPEPFVRVRISQGKLLEAYSYLARKQGALIVEPKLGKTEALENLRNKYPDVDFANAHFQMVHPTGASQKTTGWTWRVDVSWRHPDDPYCGFSQVYFLDAVSGDSRESQGMEVCS